MCKNMKYNKFCFLVLNFNSLLSTVTLKKLHDELCLIVDLPSRLHEFRLSFASDFFVRFHQAGRIIVKNLIQECNRRNNEAGVGVEPSTLRSWPS